MKKSTRILIIITRIHCKNGSHLDEFTTLWKQKRSHMYTHFSNTDSQHLILVHGSTRTEEFSLIRHLQKIIETALQALGIGFNNDIESQLLFHPISIDRTFIDHFSGEVRETLSGYNLHEPQTYSSEDDLYDYIKELAACLRNNRDFSEIFDTIWKKYSPAYNILETSLADAHRQLQETILANPEIIATQEPPKISKDHPPIFVLWNDDALLPFLKKRFGGKYIITNPETLQKQLQQHKIHKMLILAELNWHQHHLIRFYGYEIARELLDTGRNINFTFASFGIRKEIRYAHSSAAMLSRCFPFIPLKPTIIPFENLDIPMRDETDWTILRQCYFSAKGIHDRFLHDLKKLIDYPDRQAVSQLFKEINVHRQMFSEEILDETKQLQKQLFSMTTSEYEKTLKVFYDLLETFIRSQRSPERLSENPIQYQMMIIEDDSDILETLQEGFGHYFYVKGFTDSQKGLSELRKYRHKYAALLVDQELLDEDECWQPLQGHNIIKAVQGISHLVVYLITAHSKHLVSSIQRALQASSPHFYLPGYLPKDNRFGLRPDYSYKEVAEILIKEIESKSQHYQGPRNGVWGKGLLQSYYHLIASGEGKEIWDMVISAVERCIADGHNDKGWIPQRLFGITTRKFDAEKIKTVLMHRLLCLYFQYDTGEIAFEKTIKPMLNISHKDPLVYLGRLLGFSAFYPKKRLPDRAKTQICYIQKTHLFPEEITWLQKMFPENKTLRYPNLIEMFSDALSNKILAALKVWENISSVNDLADCERFLKRVINYPKLKEELKIDLQWYCQYFVHEYKQLKADKAAQELVKYIEEICGAE